MYMRGRFPDLSERRRERVCVDGEDGFGMVMGDSIGYISSQSTINFFRDINMFYAFCFAVGGLIEPFESPQTYLSWV